jgi:ferredoxin
MTTIIGLGCNSPPSTCFCTSLGGGPFSKEGSDVFLTDIGESFLVEVLTDKGARVIGDKLFQDATSNELELARRIEAEAIRKVVSVVEIEGLKEKLDGIVESPFWDTLHEKCLGCGVCTFLCPTCHCFDVVDEAWNERGERVRNWDSCMFPLYTLETSGHNPRPTGRERMRQRVMHKFNYFIVNYGEVACVGCGRCIRECPVNFDIRKAISEVWAL